MTELPIVKYPVNIKCTHIYDISDTLEEKYGLNFTNLKPDTKTKNSYHDFNFYDFLTKKIEIKPVPYPNIREISNDPRSNGYQDRGFIIKLPISYDSTNDKQDALTEAEEGRKRLTDLYKELYEGDKLESILKSMEENVNFKEHITYEYANIALEKIYDEYKDLYVDDELLVWMPFDFDTGTYFMHNDKGNKNTRYDYPIKKMLILSEVEEYIETNYNISDPNFCKFILKNNFLESRFWEVPMCLYQDEPGKFTRKGGDYGMDATENINLMLGIIENDFKDIIDFSKETVDIYIDYKTKNYNYN